MECPYCGSPAVFMTHKEFYGRDYGGNVYVCRPCDAYVGTHGRSKAPLGTMANAELRRYRNQAHAAFDPIWKSKSMHRTAAYRWMQKVMDLTPQEAHIGMFDVPKCIKLVEICSRYRSHSS
ncbi:hypothetical protein GZH47_33320 (plasmid) [Paenibacillus rhizovicinus]|uniref:Uncharacterized protein n=1 Tax=Paenibacillus rhizovicinus TaxID=2704463 RepID=A0A6C0PBE6_9BACL|nr:zinc-finger-containing protein [Paenibacillus rhizovicinus]QHW35776.1 hypothetical protein GZH47_33320 [Paenibacillus rhizovicinus]